MPTSPSDTTQTDVDSFLNPIASHNPSGDSLRYEGTYDRIREARRADAEELPQGIWEAPTKKADFKLVEELCREALEKQSKDFQIAAWLTEAWLVLEGLKGLKRGISLLYTLAQNFWDDAHPKLANNDAELRVAPFEWLNEKLPLCINSAVYISAPKEGHHPGFCFYEWTQANLYEQQIQKSEDSSFKATLEAEGKPILSALSDSISKTVPGFYKSLLSDVSENLKIISELEAFLTEKCAPQEISLFQTRKILMAIQKSATQFLTEKNAELEPVETTESTEAAANTISLEELSEVEDASNIEQKPPQAPTTVAKAITAESTAEARQEIYDTLSRLAEHLLRLEPHSPAPYLIKRAVTWGNMSLEEVLGEVVQSGGDLNQLMALLGIGSEKSES